MLRIGFLLIVIVAAATLGNAFPSSATPPPAPPRGDADCDYDIDAVDALHVLRFRAGLETGACVSFADVDCASGISAVDALKILRYLAGLLGDTPVGRCPEVDTYNLAKLYNGSFNRAVEFAMIPGSTDEAVIATQKEAKLYRVSLSNTHDPVVFGDLSDRVGGLTELEGLLAFAFSPDFANDGRIYVYYTRGAPGPSVLSRFPIAGQAIDTASETVILEVPQYIGYNMGGQIAFDKRGDLYLSVGDAAGPALKAQDINQLNGKVLRIKVAGETTYSIPSDNPLVGVDGRDEIYALGFRNPWRMSIDRLNGRIWLGDVGELTWEEVDEVKKGRNYGWDIVEGDTCWQVIPCDPGQFEPPRAMFAHTIDFTSVTGGYAYHGGSLLEMQGWYLYANFYAGDIFALNTYSNDPPVILNQTPGLMISSFAEMPSGEVVLVGFDGSIYRLERKPGT